MMGKKSASALTVRGEKPSSWANNTPPSMQKLDSIQMNVDIPVVIIVKLVLCIIVAIIVGILL